MQLWSVNNKKIKNMFTGEEYILLFSTDAEALCNILNEYNNELDKRIKVIESKCPLFRKYGWE